MGALLEAERVSRRFRIGGRTITALAPVSIRIEQGQFMVITGTSGSGKSTLLHLLSGLDRPTEGRIMYRGRALNELSEAQLASVRNQEFGFIFQTPHLLPDRTVLENVGLPFLYGPPVRQDERNRRCLELLAYVGLKPLAHRFPNTLSGGEMQRVVFARALVREPKVIFADEPTGNLDARHSRNILELLREQTSQGRTVVMVTHDRGAAAYGTHHLLLDKFAA